MKEQLSPFSSQSRDKRVTICPCCGVKFAEDFTNGCLSCGARAVGEPLPLPEIQLPSYARALILVILGCLSVLVFVTQTVIAFAQREGPWFSFWSWAMAAEAAAWRLKWVAILLTLFVFIIGRRAYKSIQGNPSRFCGLKPARRGWASAALVCIAIAILIGISVPKRLRNLQLSLEANNRALGYRLDRALREYRDQFGTYPSEVGDLRRLPDPDGSIAAALARVDSAGYKTTTADLAVVPQKKPGSLRGAAIRNASLNSGIDDSPTGSLSFTNYELRLAGIDEIFDTEDDLIVRDGVITKASEAGPGVIGSTASTSAIKP